MNRILLILPLVILSMIPPSAFAFDVPMYTFPPKEFSTNIEQYIPASNKDYSQPILTAEQQRHYFQSFLENLYGLHSPWDKAFILDKLEEAWFAQQQEIQRLNSEFLNGPPHYGQNFQPKKLSWLIKLEEQVTPKKKITYHARDRGIIVNNTFSRVLPDLKPDFFHPSLPGEGFPFDNFQASSLWSGTPVYIVATTKDKAWSLVITPHRMYAWVESDTVAKVSEKFIKRWRRQANKKLSAIVKNESTILSSTNSFVGVAYIGSVYPLVQSQDTYATLFFPVRELDGSASIRYVKINKHSAVRMPYAYTKKTVSSVLSQLIDREYGWGGRFFYNDCSEELKDLFTPFGVWLPRNSKKQASLPSTIDLSAHTPEERLALVKRLGVPFRTIIYVNGHVMLYIGQHNHQVITYQNTWGLPTRDSQGRYVIGRAVFLPLALNYHDLDVQPHITRQLFKLINL